MTTAIGTRKNDTPWHNVRARMQDEIECGACGLPLRGRAVMWLCECKFTGCAACTNEHLGDARRAMKRQKPIYTKRHFEMQWHTRFTEYEKAEFPPDYAEPYEPAYSTITMPVKSITVKTNGEEWRKRVEEADLAEHLRTCREKYQL